MANPATAPMQAAIAIFQLLFTTRDPFASVREWTRTVACRGKLEPIALPGHSWPRGQAPGRRLRPASPGDTIQALGRPRHCRLSELIGGGGIGAGGRQPQESSALVDPDE